ncbi:hypothetical protein [Rubellimicrobium roseum]|uniref:Uncharacterized protein n=1 Tax=Rubellimicrobium roseum TaxID=687525 RepID=A0A5C4N7P7_9RHOB|nr:hypothetical protein [Rubellimicrobium roseum]TNC68821.1 hypothetical protein FHG71_14460 [Rubellimicrobium roseum]
MTDPGLFVVLVLGGLLATWLVWRWTRRILRLLLLLALVGGAIWLWTGGRLPEALAALGVPLE